ncbi:MAG: hypothetical protein M1826_006496 [Phylliscum demangeonii]|nr:MAG: hypothetical protein M1826_006496 [Phylliscum demangeonii]
MTPHLIHAPGRLAQRSLSHILYSHHPPHPPSPHTSTNTLTKATHPRSFRRSFTRGPVHPARLDSSPIDAVVVPSPPVMMMAATTTATTAMKVPLLQSRVATDPSPGRHRHPTTLFRTEDDEIGARPQISTATLFAAHEHPPSALSDVVDNAAVRFDPYYDLPAEVGRAAAAVVRPLRDREWDAAMAAQSAVRRVWKGVMGAVRGPGRLGHT